MSFFSEYIKNYPESRLQDLFKLAYQRSFGCEHLVHDGGAVLARIRDEAKCAGEDACPTPVEDIGGGFCRVHLSVLREGLTAETLCRMFVLSAGKPCGGTEALEAALAELQKECETGELPFPLTEAKDAADAWRKEGFPALHHSEQFREAYHPAYRVIAREYVCLLPLLSAIDRAGADGGRVTAALDGRCASGKTTAAKNLADIYDCNVFHMDDYFLRPEQRTAERRSVPGENVDHERFLEEVLLPLSKGEKVVMRRFDCGTQELGEPKEYPAKQINIVEGVYSLHRDLAPCYTVRCMADIAPEEQRERILRRNPDTAQKFFDLWIPLEEAYFKAYRLRENTDILLTLN